MKDRLRLQHDLPAVRAEGVSPRTRWIVGPDDRHAIVFNPGDTVLRWGDLTDGTLRDVSLDNAVVYAVAWLGPEYFAVLLREGERFRVSVHDTTMGESLRSIPIESTVSRAEPVASFYRGKPWRELTLQASADGELVCVMPERWCPLPPRKDGVQHNPGVLLRASTSEVLRAFTPEADLPDLPWWDAAHPGALAVLSPDGTPFAWAFHARAIGRDPEGRPLAEFDWQHGKSRILSGAVNGDGEVDWLRWLGPGRVLFSQRGVPVIADFEESRFRALPSHAHELRGLRLGRFTIVDPHPDGSRLLLACVAEKREGTNRALSCQPVIASADPNSMEAPRMVLPTLPIPFRARVCWEGDGDEVFTAAWYERENALLVERSRLWENETVLPRIVDPAGLGIPWGESLAIERRHRGLFLSWIADGNTAIATLLPREAW